MRVIWRILRWFVLVVAVLLALVAWLLVTETGTRWTVAAVQGLMPQLSVRVTDGTFWRGLDLADLEWSMGGASVSANHVGVRWRVDCLPDSLICLDTVRSDGLRVRIDPEGLPAGEAPEEPAPAEKLDLPVGIRVGELKMLDSKVAIAGGPSIELERLTSGASLSGSDLTVADTLLRGLSIRLPGTSEAEAGDEASAGNGAAAAQGGFQLPLSLDLEGLALRGFDLEVADGVAIELEALDTAASLDDEGLVVDTTRAETLRVDVPAGGDAGAEDAGGAGNEARVAGEGGQRLELPLALRLAGLDLTDARIRVAQGPEVSFEQLSTGLSAEGDRLDLSPTTLAGLTVILPEAGEAPDRASNGASDGPLVIEPPDVTLPLDLGIAGLTLTDSVFAQGETRQVLNRFHVAGELLGSRFNVAELTVDSPMGNAALQGGVTMAGDWPVNVSLDVTANDLPRVGRQRLRGSLQGSLANLGINLQASGAVSAELTGTAEVLTPDIPWTASLAAAQLRWPLKGDPTVQASEVSLSGEGDVGSYDIRLATALDGPGIPSGQWRLDARGDTAGARIEQLSGELLGGRLGLSGQLDWAPSLSWDLALEASDLQPGRWRDAYANSRVAASLAAEGEVATDGWRLDADIGSFSGRWREQRLDLEGGLGHSVDGVWSLDELVATSGSNRVTLDGSIGEQWDLEAALAMPRLEQLWPDLAGRVDGELAITGARDEPSLAGSVDARSVAWRELSVAQGAVELDIQRLMRADSTAAITLEGLERGGEPMGDISLGLEGDRAAHRLDVSGQGLPRATAVDLGIEGGLDSDAGRWSGELASGRLVLPDGEWQLASPASLTVGRDPLDVVLGAHCWQREPASFCLREAARWGPEERSLSAALASLELDGLAPLLPPTVELGGRVDAELTAGWPQGGRPTVDLRMTATDGSIGLRRDDELEEPLRFEYRELALALDLDPDRAEIALDLDSDGLGNGAARVNVDPYSSARLLSGDVSLDGLQLGPIQPFLPALDELSGAISVDGDVAGSLTEPEFNGRVRLADGRVAIAGVSVPLTKIGVTANMVGQTARVEGSLKAGTGTATVNGDFDWSDGLSGSAELVGNGLQTGYPPIVKRLRLSPDLKLTMGGGELSLTGRLKVPSGRFVLEDLPAGSVQVSQDAVIVGDEREVAEPGGLTLKSEVLLVLGDDVRFTGMGASGRLAGELNLRQIGAAGTEANGEIRLEDGRYEAYGQKLRVRQGRFLFSGPIGSPQLDIEAVRDTGEVIAGLRVTGSANRPEVNLFSEPPMAQADALTYLLTGSGPGEDEGSDQELLAKAAMSLGVFGGDAVGSAVANKLGVEDFRMKAAGSGEDTAVQVSGRITPNLVVSYGVGVFRPENTLTLRYQLTRRIFLEAVSGLDSALDIFYSIDF